MAKTLDGPFKQFSISALLSQCRQNVSKIILGFSPGQWLLIAAYVWRGVCQRSLKCLTHRLKNIGTETMLFKISPRVKKIISDGYLGIRRSRLNPLIAQPA